MSKIFSRASRDLILYLVLSGSSKFPKSRRRRWWVGQTGFQLRFPLLAREAGRKNTLFYYLLLTTYWRAKPAEKNTLFYYLLPTTYWRAKRAEKNTLFYYLLLTTYYLLKSRIFVQAGYGHYLLLTEFWRKPVRGSVIHYLLLTEFWGKPVRGSVIHYRAIVVNYPPPLRRKIAIFKLNRGKIAFGENSFELSENVRGK